MAIVRKRKASPEHDEIIVKQGFRKHAKHYHNTPMIVAIEPKMKQSETIEECIKVAATRPKRKRDAEETPQYESRSRDKRAITSEGNTNAKLANTTPQAKRIRAAAPLSPAETPSKKTAKLFHRLGLQASTPRQQDDESAAYNTPPATPDATLDFQDVLPAPLVELVKIHAAFLSALNEQLALNSSSFRLDTKQLLRVMTSVWKRRDVTIDDLRRIMALHKYDGLGWKLEDYGRAGVSLVRIDESFATAVSIVDTARVKRSFEDALRTRWLSCRPTDAATFVSELPLATIVQSDVVDNSKALFSRGKSRLADIKSAQAASQKPADEVVVQPTGTTSQSRGTNLLDRILAKQSVNACKPAGPTQAELARRSALQRVEDIARVLEVLSAGRARASFSMQSVVQQLQQSLRNPVNRVDAELCLSIMAAEIMPQFVSIICSGNVTGVVITRAGKLGFADLKKRLADAEVY